MNCLCAQAVCCRAAPHHPRAPHPAAAAAARAAVPRQAALLRQALEVIKVEGGRYLSISVCILKDSKTRKGYIVISGTAGVITSLLVLSCRLNQICSGAIRRIVQQRRRNDVFGRLRSNRNRCEQRQRKLRVCKCCKRCGCARTGRELLRLKASLLYILSFL